LRNLRHITLAVLVFTLILPAMAYGQEEEAPSVPQPPTKLDPCVQTLVIPPYLDIAVIDIVASRRAHAAVYPPGAQQPLRHGVDDVEQTLDSESMSVFAVPHPQPGTWTIRHSRRAACMRVMSRQFIPRGRLVAPAEVHVLRQHDRARLVYQIVDGKGRPLKELPDYPLSLSLKLAKPDGTAETLRMERRPDLGEAIYASAVDVEAALAGRYWTEMRITATDAAGRRVDIFRDRWSGFSVEPADAR